MKKQMSENLTNLLTVSLVLMLLLPSTTHFVRSFITTGKYVGASEYVVAAFPAATILVMYYFFSKATETRMEDLVLGSMFTVIPFLYGVYFIYGRGPVETYVPIVGMLLIVTSGLVLIITSFKLLGKTAEKLLNKETEIETK